MKSILPDTLPATSAIRAAGKLLRIPNDGLRPLYIFIAMSGIATSSIVHAQPEILPEDKITGATDDDIQGWNPSLAVSGTVNLVSNTNVVGQVEGLSMLLGLGLAGGADYINGKSVLRTELTIAESFAKTPVVDRFLKTEDRVALSSNYSYFLTKFLGGFARAKAETSLFNARSITADSRDYVIASAKPGGMARSVTSDNLLVASAFRPFTLSESVGGFVEPLHTKPLNVLLRGGLGGRHTIASDVLVESDDALTPEVELQELANVHQAGIELFAGINGKAQDDRLSYTLGASVLMPLLLASVVGAME